MSNLSFGTVDERGPFIRSVLYSALEPLVCRNKWNLLRRHCALESEGSLIGIGRGSFRRLLWHLLLFNPRFVFGVAFTKGKLIAASRTKFHIASHFMDLSFRDTTIPASFRGIIDFIVARPAWNALERLSAQSDGFGSTDFLWCVHP